MIALDINSVKALLKLPVDPLKLLPGEIKVRRNENITLFILPVQPRSEIMKNIVFIQHGLYVKML